jgi:hypothetical protein
MKCIEFNREAFNERHFIKAMADWVELVEDMDLSRAWEIMLGCMKVHAKIDKEDGQSARESTHDAWADMVEAFLDQPATYAMLGLLTELEHMCPPDVEDDFPEVFQAAVDLACGQKVGRTPKSVGTALGRPKLVLLQGGLYSE